MEEGDEQVAATLVEASAHEGGHVRIAQLEGARVEWARAKRVGTGTTKVKGLDSLQPLQQAHIAVAGRVAEEVLLDAPMRELSEDDREVLARALQELGDPSVTEETLRVDVRCTIEAHRREVEALATVLAQRANTNVSGEDLMDAVARVSLDP